MKIGTAILTLTDQGVAAGEHAEQSAAATA